MRLVPLLLPLALSLAVSSAFAADVPAQPHAQPSLHALSTAPSEAALRATIEKLVSLGTRHTLSDTKSDKRGIGAARRWVKSQFEDISKACGGCIDVVTPSQVFTVVRSGPAVAAAGTIGYSVSDAFEGNQTITVTVEGYGAGSYYYQLDNGPILNNGGVFTNVPPCSQIQENVCEHQVTIYDYAGIGDEHCDPLVIGNIHSIDYPRFFTPNGDGINDTWNITGLAGDPSAKIYIFDRYGKLLKQIRPDLNPAMGWNGVLNGEPLPSSDYWFVVYYNENGSQKEFKAHFSLKR